ncbi:MAG: hypothetical protein CMK46_00790 [Porticoccus sp.]|nr:hypothetical protein [Porticoccus sp.]|tara:strand:- start:1361 stop:2389 length:1029 start_codon:yes stop_codon:yes gene_type:complete
MRWILVLIIASTVGCAPTLQHTKASQAEIKREAATQTRLAAQIRKEREKRLATVAASVKAASIYYCRNLEAAPENCRFPVLLVDDQSINAFADGEKVYIPVGMIRFVENDDELALIVGHELAHNILMHTNKKLGNALLGTLVDALFLASTGVDTSGAFGEAGAKAYSQGFESEADYLGLYISARAGYDIDTASLIWRRMAIEHPSAILERYNSTHPSTPERFTSLTAAADEIRSKQDRGLALLPTIRGQEQDSKAIAVVEKPPTPKEAKTAVDEIVHGRYAYQLAKTSYQAGCTNEDGIVPAVTLTSKESGQEYYRALCQNTSPIDYLCAYQQCSVISADTE